MKDKQWTDFEREDLQIIPKMIAAGYYIDFNHKDIMYKRTNPNKVPHDSVGFTKGNVHLWVVIRSDNGEIGWRKADLIDGRFSNHSYVDTPLDEIKL